VSLVNWSRRLIVFESSAKDGSRINLVEITLRMRR
jgi:hypothetical protein